MRDPSGDDRFANGDVHVRYESRIEGDLIFFPRTAIVTLVRAGRAGDRSRRLFLAASTPDARVVRLGRTRDRGAAKATTPPSSFSASTRASLFRRARHAPFRSSLFDRAPRAVSSTASPPSLVRHEPRRHHLSRRRSAPLVLAVLPEELPREERGDRHARVLRRDGASPLASHTARARESRSPREASRRPARARRRASRRVARRSARAGARRSPGTDTTRRGFSSDVLKRSRLDPHPRRAQREDTAVETQRASAPARTSAAALRRRPFRSLGLMPSLLSPFGGALASPLSDMEYEMNRMVNGASEENEVVGEERRHLFLSLSPGLASRQLRIPPPFASRPHSSQPPPSSSLAAASSPQSSTRCAT